MAMVVNHNIPALQTYNTVNRTNSALEKSIQKLSTGLRINSAADDAAGLAISEKMRAQVNGMDRAVSNAQDGISMIQTAEGALNETHDILQRMRELAVQASNDTLTSQDRSYIQLEIDELRDEVTRIGNTTQFNKKKLLNGDAAVIWSSDNLETKAVVNGGLRSLDQFGQKVVTEGNYRIKVKASAGQGEVQKTDIMRIKHDVDPWYTIIDSTKGAAPAELQKHPEGLGQGTYAVKAQIPDATVNAGATNNKGIDLTPTVVYNVGGSGSVKTTGLVVDTDLQNNYSLKFEVTNVKNAGTDDAEITMSVKGYAIGKDGVVDEDNPVETTLTFTAASYAAQNIELSQDKKSNGTARKLQIDLTNGADDVKSGFAKGDSFVLNVAAQAKEKEDVVLTVQGEPVKGSMSDHHFTFNKAKVQDKTLDMKVAYIETDPGDPSVKELKEGSVYLTTTKSFGENVHDGTLVTYKKGVDIPKDSDDGWLGTMGVPFSSGEVSKNMPKGGSYAVTAKAAVGTGTAAYNTSFKVLQDTKDNMKELTDRGWALSSGAKVEASGILELEITSASYGTTTAASPNNHVFDLTVKGNFYGMDKDGADASGALQVTATGLTQTTAGALPASTATTLELKTASGKALGKFDIDASKLGNFQPGEKIYLQVTAEQDATNDVVLSVSGQNADKSNAFTYTPTYVIKAVGNQDKTFDLTGLAVSSDGSSVDFEKYEWDKKAGDIKLKGVGIDSSGYDTTTLPTWNNKTVASFKWGADNPTKISSSIGDLADRTTSLYDIEKFWDSQGVFMLNEPQTITLTQGDGKQASITLYKDDTVGSMVDKLNNAIANDLGQGKYVDDASKFATFVDKPTEDDTSESVQGTILVRTVVPGSSGTIRFSGNEDVINALSLNTLQSAKESTYTVNIEDAHTGKKVVTDANVTGNKLVGALHPNIDVVFDATAGITGKWDEESKSYKMDADSKGYETYLHLTDNTTVFQVGANEGEDMGIHIGDMRAEALGLNRVLVTDRESASHSITLIDNAIDKVSTQRAKLGAYQNRLEHTINNLNTASENITAAESRIRDTDMAKEMMNFTKLQIMLQAGTSMLAQANQLPQNVMALVR